MSQEPANHSITVPTQYRAAAKILRKSLNENVPIKSLIFLEKHARTNRLLALLTKVSERRKVLDQLIESSQILVREPRLDPAMCRILMTEMLFGNKMLNGQSKPVLKVLEYMDQFNTILSDIGVTVQTDNKRKVIKPRYVRVNTLSWTIEEAVDAFNNDGWRQIYFDHELNTSDLNSNLFSYDDFLKKIRSLADDEFIADYHVRNLFVFPPNSKRYWAQNEMVTESKVLLQDKASCIPAQILNPPPTATVLDMCAAPGMKTTHLAAIMQNKGKIYATEQSATRFETLKAFTKSTKSKCVTAINVDVLTIGDEDVPNVKYILLDPSCSGSGMTDRIDEDEDEYLSFRLRSLSNLQIKMLKHAMTKFPNVKKIVYSTCSLYSDENEKVVAEALRNCPQFKLKDAKKLLGREWKNFGSATEYGTIGPKCLYSLPEVDMTNGFFVAVFKKRKNNQV